MQKGESLRTMIIHVDSYQDAVPKGWISHLHGEARRFQSLTELLLQLAEMFDEAKFPQAFERIRQFSEQKAENSKEIGSNPSRGQLATFEIRILFRQNTSWQGLIYWLEGKEKESFRSVLELIFLMDSALRKSYSNCPTAYPHSERENLIQSRSNI